MSAEPQQTDAEHEDGVPAALHLSAVRQRRLRVVGGGTASTPEAAEQAEETERGAHPSPSSDRSGTARRRRPLASAPARARRRRIPLIIATFAGVLLTLGFALLMNITISQNQYDLVQLRAEQQDLTEQNQALNQEIEYHQAPQNLAARASQLGMVSQAQQAQLDVRDGKLSGTPTAAEPLGEDPKQAAEQGRTNLIDPPQGSDTDAARTAEQRAKEQAEKDRAAQKKADDQKKAEEKEQQPQRSAAPTPSADAQHAEAQERTGH